MNAMIKPYSHWQKSDIAAAFEKAVENGLTTDLDIRLFQKIPCQKVKSLCLIKAAGDGMYKIDFGKLTKLTPDDITVLTGELHPVKEVWRCSFVESIIINQTVRAKRLTEVGIVHGKWFYRKNGKRKLVTSKTFKFIEKIGKEENHEQNNKRS
jgi:hypothetical protein